MISKQSIWALVISIVFVSFTHAASLLAPAKKIAGVALAALAAQKVYKMYCNYQTLAKEASSLEDRIQSPHAHSIREAFAMPNTPLILLDLQNLIRAYYGPEWEPLLTLRSDATESSSILPPTIPIVELIFSPGTTMITAQLANRSSLVWSLPEGFLQRENRVWFDLLVAWRKHNAGPTPPEAYSPKRLYKAVVTDFIPHEDYFGSHDSGHTFSVYRSNGKLIENALALPQ